MSKINWRKAGLVASFAAAAGIIAVIDTPDHTRTQAALQQQGYTEIETNYAGIMSKRGWLGRDKGCDATSNDINPTSFTAKDKTGATVSGIVCSEALLKEDITIHNDTSEKITLKVKR